jgi:hypothetical protein
MPDSSSLESWPEEESVDNNNIRSCNPLLLLPAHVMLAELRCCHRSPQCGHVGLAHARPWVIHQRSQSWSTTIRDLRDSRLIRLVSSVVLITMRWGASISSVFTEFCTILNKIFFVVLLYLRWTQNTINYTIIRCNITAMFSPLGIC